MKGHRRRKQPRPILDLKEMRASFDAWYDNRKFTHPYTDMNAAYMKGMADMITFIQRDHEIVPKASE